MPKFIRKLFKTPTRALKRAKFENAHKPRYHHTVVSVSEGWRVKRELKSSA